MNGRLYRLSHFLLLLTIAESNIYLLSTALFARRSTNNVKRPHFIPAQLKLQKVTSNILLINCVAVV